MRRRTFLKAMATVSVAVPWAVKLDGAEATAQPEEGRVTKLDDGLRKDWLARWETHILGGAKERYCDREMGEEIGWLISPFLNGFYYGYRATGDTQWVERLTDWADSWVKRGIKEPDGFTGWPKSGTGGAVASDF
jgi:hypothetical protein